MATSMFFLCLAIFANFQLATIEAVDCWVPGRCEGYLVDLSMTSNQEDCLAHCKDLSNCKWFTYDEAHRSCAIFSACTKWDGSCTTCISGEQECEV